MEIHEILVVAHEEVLPLAVALGIPSMAAVVLVAAFEEADHAGRKMKQEVPTPKQAVEIEELPLAVAQLLTIVQDQTKNKKMLN